MNDSPKPLSLKQAQACETARHPTCKCRCGGAKHGANRQMGGISADQGPLIPNEEFFATLPPDDPHFRETRSQRVARLRRERQEAQQRKWEMLARVGVYD